MHESRTTRAFVCLCQYSEKMVLERAKHSSSTQKVLAQYFRRILNDYHVRKKNDFESYVSFQLEQLINVLLRAESICPQSTRLLSIFYLCYGFSHYAYLGYAFSRYAYMCYASLHYAYLRYAFLRYAYMCYAFLHYAYLRYAYLRYANLCYAFLRYASLPYAFFSLCLLPLSLPFCILTSCMIPETAFCPSA